MTNSRVAACAWALATIASPARSTSRRRSSSLAAGSRHRRKATMQTASTCSSMSRCRCFTALTLPLCIRSQKLASFSFMGHSPLVTAAKKRSSISLLHRASEISCRPLRAWRSTLAPASSSARTAVVLRARTASESGFSTPWLGSALNSTAFLIARLRLEGVANLLSASRSSALLGVVSTSEELCRKRTLKRKETSASSSMSSGRFSRCRIWAPLSRSRAARARSGSRFST
mmetsp:Transcript_59113/g.140857  ORF Transcript_59113/g.140857 Transcript_59113/m.140857 type:complete len:231 (+) Transcript_59113:258-950(+)